MDLLFGPVPSRRLGKSLGVNNIPNKICSYGCVYCQLGRTSNFQIERRKYYSPEEIFSEAKTKIEKIDRKNIDYITFVPDGEPTLDINLGREAYLLKSLDIPLAIITNSSLVDNDKVREDLMNFDLISLKIDAVTEENWRNINRPDPRLNLNSIKQGIVELSSEYKGKLITETMMINGINYDNEISQIAQFLKIIHPSESYISIPIRPTPEKWALPPEEGVLNKAYQVFSGVVTKVEFLTGSEVGEFYSTGDFEKDVLSITSVHPIRDDFMDRFLKKYGKNYEIIERMIEEKKIVKVLFNDHYFFLRNFKERVSLFH
jgi:wyosine [tRNA(Phe)-imidazoG37] synthetase (radical SAM superfamily)